MSFCSVSRQADWDMGYIWGGYVSQPGGLSHGTHSGCSYKANHEGHVGSWAQTSLQKGTHLRELREGGEMSQGPSGGMTGHSRFAVTTISAADCFQRIVLSENIHRIKNMQSLGQKKLKWKKRFSWNHSGEKSHTIISFKITDFPPIV